MYQSDPANLQEPKLHGTLLFPFNIYPCTIPGDFPFVALHWHKSMELIYVKKGMGRIQMGNVNYIAHAGHIFVIPPDTLHALRCVAGHTMEYENFIFQIEFLGSNAADVCAQRYLIPLTSGQLLHPILISPDHAAYEKISACLKEAEDLCEEKGLAYEVGVKAAMLRLLLHLIRLQPIPPARESADTLRLKQVLQFVQDHFTEKLTVTQAAQCCGFSTSHFMRWFKERTGNSFTSYVNECRLAQAAEKLGQTSSKILTIAQETGFESLANFNRQFKARYGITPREYRNGGQLSNNHITIPASATTKSVTG